MMYPTLKSLFIVLTLCLAGHWLSLPVWAADFFVAPTGVAEGRGTKDSPWDLQTALHQRTVIKPGDVIWLRGGTYGTGRNLIFTNKLKGAAGQPIVIRNYPGERAIINGGIGEEATMAGHIWYWGLEITNTESARQNSDWTRSFGVNLHGEGSSAINLVIYNAGHPNIGMWTGVKGGVAYGNILWGSGIYDEKVTGGSPTSPITRGSVYMQNSTGERRVENNIAFRNFTVGLKAYGDVGGVSNFTFTKNIVFDNPQWNLFAGRRTSGIENIKMIDNVIYSEKNGVGRGVITAGYQHHVKNQDVTITGNTAVGKGSVLEIAPSGRSQVKNNTFVSLDNQPVIFKAENDYIAPDGSQMTDFLNVDETVYENNQYFTTHQAIAQRNIQRLVYTSFLPPSASTKYENIFPTLSQWQASGKDQGSRQIRGVPTTNQTFVFPNAYQAGRGHLAVLNWESKASQTLDVSSILRPGDAYELRDAQNYFTIIATGVYDGSLLNVPLQLTAAAETPGVTHFTNQHTPTLFNAFVINTPARELEVPNRSFTFSDPRSLAVITPQPTPQPSPTVAPSPSPLPTLAPSPSPEPTVVCKGDINNDKVVDLEDYIILKGDFGKLTSDLLAPVSDLNQDGVVNITDFAILAARFLRPCSE